LAIKLSIWLTNQIWLGKMLVFINPSFLALERSCLIFGENRMPLFSCPKCEETLYQDWDSYIEITCTNCCCKFTAEYDEIRYKDEEGFDVCDDFWHIEMVRGYEDE
jgi:hypothetical protein